MPCMQLLAHLLVLIAARLVFFVRTTTETERGKGITPQEGPSSLPCPKTPTWNKQENQSSTGRGGCSTGLRVYARCDTQAPTKGQERGQAVHSEFASVCKNTGSSCDALQCAPREVVSPRTLMHAETVRQSHACPCVLEAFGLVHMERAALKGLLIPPTFLFR